MVFWRKAVLFYIGGCAYVALELIWRGRSHGSMFLAGGLCLVLIGQLKRLPLPFLLKAVLGAAVITAVELIVGLIVNRDYAVWDYRSQPGNILGQICPLFSLLWIAAAALVLLIHDPLERRIQMYLCR